MQKWDYLIVDADESNGWRVKALNGAELQSWRTGPPLSSQLSWCGRHGWQLAGVSPTVKQPGDEQYLTYVFKRPKS